MKEKLKSHQTRASRRKQQKGRIKASVFVAIITMSCCIMTVAAANPFGDFSDDFKTIYNIAKSILLPCAALAVVYGGLCFFGIDLLSQKNTEKQIEKGKLVIRYACVSVALFYLLPAVINLSVNTFSPNAWKPDNPNGGISSSLSQHVHDWQTRYQITAPTCTSNGLEVQYCTKCSSTRKIEPNMYGHNWNKNEEIITAATCTTEGKAKRRCERCGATDTRTIPASHDFNPQGVCMRCGAQKDKPVQ